MSDKAREAWEKYELMLICSGHIASQVNLGQHVFYAGYQAATEAARAEYLPVVEKLVEAVRLGKQLRDTFGGNVGGGRDVYAEALALAAPLLGGK